jgi:hypothetical protein
MWLLQEFSTKNRISFNKIKLICNTCNLGCAEAGRILLCGIRRACPAPDAVGPGGTRSYPFTSFQGKGISSASSRIQDPMHLRRFKIQGSGIRYLSDVWSKKILDRKKCLQIFPVGSEWSWDGKLPVQLQPEEIRVSCQFGPTGGTRKVATGMGDNVLNVDQLLARSQVYVWVMFE